MGGTLEGMSSETPLLCVPVWADQPGAAARVAAAGAGLIIDKRGTSFDEVTDSLNKLLYEESFSANAQRISQLLQFAGGSQRAAELVFLLLDTGGRGEHLKDLYEVAPVWKYQLTTAAMVSAPLMVLSMLTVILVRDCFCTRGESLKDKQE
jgi:hypothetical protein